MIRRGLQILSVVGITALGAAPSHGQMMPNFLTVNGIGGDWNGGYALVGSQFVDTWSGYVFTWAKYDGTNSTRWATVIRENHPQNSPNSYSWYVRLYASEPASASLGFSTGWTYQGSVTGTNASFPNVVPLTGGASAILTYLNANPYAGAFPDWESAGVKIPLGFGLGLAAWASFLALGIPMRWVKELTNAAT